MTDANSTIRRLAEITDAALFERLATAVLRSFNPELYGSLSHPGVNSEGKTVKAPLDNVGWIRDAVGERIVGAAHSTDRAKDIFDKWLHDPSTVKPRTPGRKPTAPEGDLRKAIREINELRVSNPNLQATFVLTSNREPDPNCVVAANKIAADAGFDLDIWSASRLAYYLDNNAQGQWLRRTHLNAPIQLMSKELLLNCTRTSLQEHFHQVNPDELIVRSNPIQQSTKHTLLIGPSGMGKTTMALQMLQVHLEAGGHGLVISHETLGRATSLVEAIDIELRKLEPDLLANSGHRALALTSDICPLWIIVEDANRASDPSLVLNKVLSWAIPRSPSAGGAVEHWRLICPIWPRYLDSLDQSLEVTKNTLLHTLGVYSDREAVDAVMRRASAMSLTLSPAEIAAIAKALANDPLLIVLHDYTSATNAAKVVDSYVDKELAKAAANAPNLMHSELSQAVDALVRQMLLHRNMAPSWTNISEWLNEVPTMLSALRVVVKAGSVVRLQQGERPDVLMPRHDRVLLSLMSRVIAQDLRGRHLETAYLSDPYFAEAVGVAALNARLNLVDLQQLIQKNPLALFYAFQHAARWAIDYQDFCTVIRTWLEDDATHAVKFRSTRWHALHLLAEIDSNEVVTLTDLFRQDDRNVNWCQARFRNGSFLDGLRLLTTYPFGSTIAGRPELLQHIFARYRKKFLKSSRDILIRTDISDRVVSGALYLAGYLGDPALAPAICSRWHLDNPAKRDLEAYLWASARCYDGVTDGALALVCDAWASLHSGEESECEGHSRNSMAAHGISWEFMEYMPVAAIPYFVHRAQSDTLLTWPIAYMLRGIDQPAAVDYLARYVAERESYLWVHIFDDWERRQRERGIQMSDASKNHLLSLALNGINELQLRKSAFHIWGLTTAKSDLQNIHSIRFEHDLYKKAIWARARRGDKTVIPELIEIIPSNPSYWWQTGRYLWSGAMTIALHQGIQELVVRKNLGTLSEHDSESILSERLMELDGHSAERILITEWESLKTSPHFVQAAIYHCTPRLVTLARAAIESATEPKNLFEYVTIRMGWKMAGRKGIQRVEQVELLATYADLLSDLDILVLWEICNDQGWFQLRQKYFDVRVRVSEKLAGRMSAKVDLSDLDKSLDGNLFTRLYYWFEQHEHRGISKTELMNALFDWLRNHKSLCALETVCKIFYGAATRSDLEGLQIETAMWLEDAGLIEDLAFSIRRRTLQ
jgi:hypothetical protein